MKVLPQGQQNAVPAVELAEILNYSDVRTMQSDIREARESGQLICSCAKGYFKPESKEEIEQYIKTLRSRALSTIKTVRTATAFLQKNQDQLSFDDIMEGFTNEQT